MYITQIPILKTTNLFTIDDNHQPTFVHADHPNYQLTKKAIHSIISIFGISAMLSEPKLEHYVVPETRSMLDTKKIVYQL